MIIQNQNHRNRGKLSIYYYHSCHHNQSFVCLGFMIFLSLRIKKKYSLTSNSASTEKLLKSSGSFRERAAGLSYMAMISSFSGYTTLKRH